MLSTGIRSTLVLLYILFDIGLSILFLGCYTGKTFFDADLIFKFLFFVDGYNFIDNPFDFVFISLLRTLFLISAILLVTFHKDAIARCLFMSMLGFAIFTYSFTLVKFLAFSEIYEQMTYPGVWMSCVWSIITSVLFSSIWYFVISAQSISYQRLISFDEASADAEENVARTTTDAEAPTATNDYTTPQIRMSTASHIWLLLKYCNNQWQWFLAGFVFLVIYAAARVFIPAYIGQVIGDIVKMRGFSVLVHSVLVMSGLCMLSSFFGGLRGGCFDYATALVNRQVRMDLFNSLVRQDIAFFDITKSGEMVSRLTSDCQTMASTVSTNLNVFLRNGVMLIGALVYMFIMSWRLCLVTFIAVPVVGFITKWYGAYYDKLSETTQDTIAKANQMAEEVLSTMRTVRSFACEKREAKRFEDLLNSTLKINKKKSIAYMGYTWSNEFTDNAILVAVLFYGGHLVMTGKMTSDNLITFLLYQMQLGENLYYLGYVVTGLMESVGASRKVFEYMNRAPLIPLDGQLRPPVNGEIEFDAVQFTYPSRPNNQVLKNLNLKVGAGETVALVGPSGGGKSSIVSLIQHFYEPSDGGIKLDGVPIRDISHVYYHQKIALVAQEPVLYDGSVRYNILYGCDWATEDDMLEAAKTANVHDFVMELEKGYDTNCGEKGVQMSGGQKQRIAIARALVRKPAVLILDEATSALDAESEGLVQEALSRCANERTVLIIAHRLSTIEKADRIAVIQKGTMVQSGSHAQLMEDREGLYYSLVARQMLSSIVGEPE